MIGFEVTGKYDRESESDRTSRLACLQLTQRFAGQAEQAVLLLDEAEDILQRDY